MSDDQSRSRLGRGLAALIGDVDDESAVVERARGARRVPVEMLRPNPNNPRKVFADTDLEDLSNSVREKGIVQPILVRNVGDPDSYEIIAGERRWRAAQRAGLHEVPVLVLEVGDREALELAIIENVQRADLNALEEAAGYEALISQHHYNQNDVAKIVGKSRSHVANTLRLMKLPETVQTSVRSGELTAGHARALINVGNPEAVARRIIDRGLSVRQAEALAQEESETKPVKRPRIARGKDEDTLALERALSDALGLSVSVEHTGPGGEIRIRYGSLEQLDSVCRRLRG
ncbi:chromosome partitioning protein ParB [Agaricicola taiwanensis]|uniref:Chromosome partitioning protein ParB n=1 Tax=Agaricicola taiwanensis TaxID=591372 RepID=A0A8J2VEH2_9RHOB|nr:ParB/RepB/Spo0J family partition protein [Agaricicola taiwanensis]GGE28763.1 chromosome partitioning protein ParB [Agaricicola taiwanensis]